MINGDAVYLRLKEKYEEKVIDEIPGILNSIEKNQRRYNLKDCLYQLQDICNQLYYVYGASDEVILFQALINQYRHEFDIVDENEIIHHMNDGDFVQ